MGGGGLCGRISPRRRTIGDRTSRYRLASSESDGQAGSSCAAHWPDTGIDLHHRGLRQLTPDELASQIIRAIAKYKKVPVERVRLESTFEELDIDSLDGLEFFFEIEGEFGVNIPDNQLRSLRTVRQAVDCIQQLVAAK